MTRTLNGVALLAAPTLRSQAYAQALAAAGLMPELVISLPGPEPASHSDRQIVLTDVDGLRLWPFRPGEPVNETLANVRCVVLETADLNHPATHAAFRSLAGNVVIFSGPPGVILRDAALASGPRFLHVHGGSAPAFRGSTAFYYEMLERGTFGVTALWLARALDRGSILARRSFAPPREIEFDRVFDPMVRAALLVDVLDSYDRTGVFPSDEQPEAAGRVHYVIHPVLKHVVLRRCAILDPDPQS